MSISAKDASKKDISFKEIKVHIEQELKIIDEKILSYPVIPGINTLEYQLPKLENILSNYTPASLNDLTIMFYGKLISNLLDRGFVVAIENERNAGDVLLISWESEFDAREFEKCLYMMKSSKLNSGEKNDFKQGKAPYDRIKKIQKSMAPKPI